jgi:flagellar biosynthesis protein FlhA
MSRVKGIRKKLSAELGFLVPAVRIRDVLTLEPNSYNILVNGVVRASGQIRPDRELAINPGHAYGKLEGLPTQDPAFGLEATWIAPSQKDYARTLGYTVVDASTALATHLNKVLRENAADLVSQDETQQLLDKLAARFPKLVENLVPGKIQLSVLTRVLQNLLSESVPIRDMRSIVETLSEESAKTQDPEELTGLVRPRLGRMIVQNLVGVQEVLPVITLEPGLERMLQNAADQTGTGQTAVLEPDLAESLFKALRNGAAKTQEQHECAILVVSPSVRPWLAKLLKHRVGDLMVLSYSEIPDDQAVKVVLTIETQSKQQ